MSKRRKQKIFQIEKVTWLQDTQLANKIAKRTFLDHFEITYFSDRPYDLAVYENKLSMQLIMGKSHDRMDLSALYRALFWFESPLMHMSSNLKYLTKMNDPVHGFLESENSRGVSESNIHGRLSSIVEDVLSSDGRAKHFTAELTSLLTECSRVHSTTKSLATDMLAFTTFVSSKFSI